MNRTSCIGIIFIHLVMIILIFSNYTLGQQIKVSDTSKKKLNVVTSVAPITDIVKNIGGERINLIGLVPEGVNSHTFEPVPSDAIKINNADLVMIDGLNLETSIENIAKNVIAKNPKIHFVRLAENSITKDDWIFDFSFPKEQGYPNPHLWLNVEYAMKFANITANKLIEIDPSNSKYYISNSQRYDELLKELDKGIKKSVDTIPRENRKLLTYHDSWAYFAARYGMTVIGAIQPSDFGEPSPQDVVRLIEQIRTENIPALFASEVFPTTIIDQIAKEANVTIVETLSDDDLPGTEGGHNHSYIGMMLENMKNMILPLGGNIEPLKEIIAKDGL